MSSIVLVHGIAQEQFGADVLEDLWVPAIASGVRTAGRDAFADHLAQWRTGQARAIRMAYYGDLFLPAGSQGSSAVDMSFTPEASELSEEFARAWLEAAAVSAFDHQDRLVASRQLDLLFGGAEGSQGYRASMRPIENALARLRWFAPQGMSVAGRFVRSSLQQVARYFTDEAVRAAAQARVLQHIGSETRLVIAHSLVLR